MSEIVVKVENLSKKYFIGRQGYQNYTCFRDVMTSVAKRFTRSFLPPYNRMSSCKLSDPEDDFFALDDVSFEIKRGDRVGIIGRNGAGKSTLLKILSRITEPTNGQVTIDGRVASLLEVGTGFHPELTGCENIFLNGAILGMSKAEIRKKFDEIVAFAEVERFLDTPVKRYSSGMFVRLAFAVAAHLDPEVLIVDEVLAVGDAQFQKKCLGKMEEVGKDGRTVIFVSHSMPTVASLCETALLFESGKLVKSGPTPEVVLRYYSNAQSNPASASFLTKNVGDGFVRLLKAEIKKTNGEVALNIDIDESIVVEMQFEVCDGVPFCFVPNFHFYNSGGVCAFVAVSDERHLNKKGVYSAKCYIPANLLNEGTYFVSLALSSFEVGVKIHFFERDALSFNIRDPLTDLSSRAGWSGVMPGVIRPNLSWKTELR